MNGQTGAWFSLGRLSCAHKHGHTDSHRWQNHANSYIFPERWGHCSHHWGPSFVRPAILCGCLFHPHFSPKADSTSSTPSHHQHHPSLPLSADTGDSDLPDKLINSMPRTRHQQLLEVLLFWLYMALVGILPSICCLLGETLLWRNFQWVGKRVVGSGKRLR